MGVFVIKIYRAEKCQRCEKEISADTVVLEVWIDRFRKIICQDCVEVLWKNIEVRNKLKEEEKK